MTRDRHCGVLTPRMDFSEMNLLQAIILGIVQGIGEFLPISSSGHLIIVGELLGSNAKGSPEAEKANLLFNVVVHIGTLLSVLVVYRQEIWKLRQQPKVCLNIVLASIPAGVIGLLFKDDFERIFSTPLVVGVCWFGTAAMLLVGQRLERNETAYADLSPMRAFVIGLFQMAALLPGISRSGSTISGGLLCGMQRSSAGAFSFLMSIPVVGGAVLLEGYDVATGKVPLGEPLPLVVGAITSFIVGMLVLKWLVRLLSQGCLHWFAYYCIAAGTLTVVWQLFAAVKSAI